MGEELAPAAGAEGEFAAAGFFGDELAEGVECGGGVGGFEEGGIVLEEVGDEEEGFDGFVLGHDALGGELGIAGGEAEAEGVEDGGAIGVIGRQGGGELGEGAHHDVVIGGAGVVGIQPATGEGAVGELTGDDTEQGFLHGGVEVAWVLGDGVGFGEKVDTEGVVVPVGAEGTGEGPVGGFEGGGEVAGVLGEVVEVEEGEGAFGVVELEAAVAMVFEGPAVADGLSEFAGFFGAIEEAGGDLHGAGLGGAAGGGEGEAARSGLFLRPEEEVGGLVGEGEAFGAALEVGFGDGGAAGDDGGGGAEGFGEGGGIEAGFPGGGELFEAGEVGGETELGDGGVEEGGVGGDFLVGVGDFGGAGAVTEAEAFGLDEGLDGLGVFCGEGGGEFGGNRLGFAGMAGGEGEDEEVAEGTNHGV